MSNPFESKEEEMEEEGERAGEVIVCTREDLFRRWFLYTISSMLTLVSLICVHDDGATGNTDARFRSLFLAFPQNLVLLLTFIGVWATWWSLYDDVSSSSSSSWFPIQRINRLRIFLLLLLGVIVIPSWWTILVVIMKKIPNSPYPDDDTGGLAVAASLFCTWIAMGISLDTLLRFARGVTILSRQADDADNNNNNNNNGDCDDMEDDWNDEEEKDRAILWTKFSVAIVLHGYFSFYPNASSRPSQSHGVFLLARVVSFVLLCTTVVWMIVSSVLYRKQMVSRNLPLALALSWFVYGCFMLCSADSIDTHSDDNTLLLSLTPLLSLGGTVCYALRLSKFMSFVQLWKERRKSRFIRWIMFAWACTMNLISLSFFTIQIPVHGDDDRGDRDHPTPNAFVWTASWIMQLFLLIHAVAALHFYRQHEKANIILENWLVRHDEKPEDFQRLTLMFYPIFPFYQTHADHVLCKYIYHVVLCQYMREK